MASRFRLLACMVFGVIHGAETSRWKREEATIGKPCQEPLDCGQGSYCDNNKMCSCLSTHVRVNGFCWPSKSCRKVIQKDTEVLLFQRSTRAKPDVRTIANVPPPGQELCVKAENANALMDNPRCRPGMDPSV